MFLLANSKLVAYNLLVNLIIHYPSQDSKRPEPRNIISLGMTRYGLENVMKFYDCLASSRFFLRSYNDLIKNCVEFARSLSKTLVETDLPADYLMSLERKTFNKLGSSLIVLPAVNSMRPEVEQNVQKGGSEVVDSFVLMALGQNQNIAGHKDFIVSTKNKSKSKEHLKACSKDKVIESITVLTEDGKMSYSDIYIDPLLETKDKKMLVKEDITPHGFTLVDSKLHNSEKFWNVASGFGE